MRLLVLILTFSIVASNCNPLTIVHADTADEGQASQGKRLFLNNVAVENGPQYY